MAVQLVDRVIEEVHERFSKSKYQLLGATCLFISSKYEQTFPISAHRVAYLCGQNFKVSHIFEMEAYILSKLEFNLVQTTSYHLLQFWNRIALENNWGDDNLLKLSQKEQFLAQYILNLTLNSTNLIKHQNNEILLAVFSQINQIRVYNKKDLTIWAKKLELDMGNG
jgi:hypothetical protein